LIIPFALSDLHLLVLGSALGPPPLCSGLGVVENRVLGKGRLRGDEVGALQLKTKKAEKITDK
jgi:hypothetical protein